MIRAFGLALIKVILIIVGLAVVPMLLPFRKTDDGKRLPTGWVFSNIFGWFGNPFDGLYGDKRGWWICVCRAAGRDPYGYLSMWLWSAVRNPVNAWSRLVVGCDVSRCEIVKVWGDEVVIEAPGKGGIQYLVATRDDGKRYPRFFAVVPWFFSSSHAVMLDTGWKVKLAHNGTSPDARPSDRYKGLVFTASLWKKLA